ncbi:MAG: hypothetical protein IT380_15055 [Myxococcales bacterium]|nr:hypothetical protein [Myxococcales bacterium]
MCLALCACSATSTPSTCGNGRLDPGEVCDGPLLREETCLSRGWGTGTLACADTCRDFDTRGCVVPTGGGSGGGGGGGGDAGPGDAGTSPDAGAMDAGGPAAGVPDAGPSMALTVRNGRLEHQDGRAVDVRGAISCCGGAFGWPLFDEAWLDTVAPRGATFLHMRLGPFRTEGNGETDWAAVGGGYVEANGQADLTRFNERFWSRVRELLGKARARGLYVEVDVVDGWGVKHCRWGDLPGYSAWEAAFNAQGLDGCATAASGPVAPGGVHEAWIRKVVAETGAFDNVLYEDGNEVGLVQGYDSEWTRTMAVLIRDEEARRGYPRHLFGTNSGDATAMQLADVDYLEEHQNQPLAASQCFGKPCFVNEYNPNPPLSPAQFHQRFCAARDEGTAFFYWRHGQSEADMLQSLTLMGQGCP